MASLALTLLADPDAHAGSYSGPVYTGTGSCSQPGPPIGQPPTSQITTYSYSAVSGGWGGNSGGQATATCSGSIIATFTWVPATGQTLQTDPPPSQVIQVETAAASASGTSYPSPPVASASYDDGLGGSGKGVVSFENGPPSSSSTSCSGSNTKYSVVSGGATVTATGSPTATGFGAGKAGSSGVSYSASISPVTISLGGAVKDSSGNYSILVGQGCTATISGLPSFSQASGGSITYAWTVSGTTFQDWEPAPSSNPQASYYDPGPGTQTNSTYHWYWNDFGPGPTTETVKCTATVTPPAGQGNAFSVNTTQSVKVYVPSLSGLGNQVGMGYIRSTQQNNVTNSQMIALQPGTPPAGNGSIWTAAVSLPTTPNFGSGTWAYLQLIKAGEYIASPGQKATSKDTLRGEGLDGSFPYQGDTYSTDGRQYTNGDDPYLGMLNSTIPHVVMTSSFHTYLMFQPPANSTKDVRWVPLALSLWSTNFNASLNQYDPSVQYTVWTDYPATQSVGPVQLGYSFVSQNSFPSWTQIITGSDDGFVQQ